MKKVSNFIHRGHQGQTLRELHYHEFPEETIEEITGETMRLQFLFAGFASLFFLQPSWSGGGSLIGNGGDTIFCEASVQNHFYGHYTLDYLLKYKTGEALSPQTMTLPSTILRLQSYFTKNYPEILPLFLDFMQNIRQNLPSTRRQWIASTTALADVHDEAIINQIPENCLRKDADGTLKPHLFQTVIRKSFFDPIQYFYSSEILNSQEKQNPLQYSFFMVHEWLWDLSQDVEVVRKLNWLFHSEKLDTLSRANLITVFENLEIFQLKLPLCERSTLIKSQFSQPCEKISLTDMRQIKTLEFQNLPPNFLFRVGDFYGFSQLNSLKIQGKNLDQALHPRIFEPLYILKQLDLSDSHITALSPEITKDLESLEVLKIDANESLFNTKEKIQNLPVTLKTLVLFSNDFKLSQDIRQAVNKIRPDLDVILKAHSFRPSTAL